MRKLAKALGLGATLSLLAVPSHLGSYPLDGYAFSGISRLEQARLAQAGEAKGRKLPTGALLPMSSIELSKPTFEFDPQGGLALPTADVELSRNLRDLFSAEDRARYGIALLDLTDPRAPVYAGFNDGYRSNVGSVGKVLVAVSLFQQLADLYPDNIEARRLILGMPVIADSYVEWDSHQVPIYDVETQNYQYRPLRRGDVGTLWEYLDWMLSASSNGAASMVLQQATLLNHFGHDYPQFPETHQKWLAETDRQAEGDVMNRVLRRGHDANGIDWENLRQGRPFTRGAKSQVTGVNSYGTPRELVRMLYAMEAGQLVDEWSSLELKRLLYMTQRRIRYASHPALHDSAVFFKSGSLYGCEEEEGYVCEKYKGNRMNILASVAVVESPADAPKLRYAVALLSNVLYVNSSVAHQTLAMRIHRLLERRHAELLEAGDGASP